MILGAMSYDARVADAYGELGVDAVKCVLELEMSEVRPTDEWMAEHVAFDYFTDLRFHRSLMGDARTAGEYAAWCGHVVKAFPECSDFILWEEPNCPVISGANCMTYSKLATMAIEEMRTVRDVKIYNGGMGVHGQAWDVQQLADGGALEKFDAVNLHPFVFEPNREDMVQVYDNLFDRLAVYQMPVVITEFGIPSAPENAKYPSLLMKQGVFAPNEGEQAWRLDWCLRKFYSEGVGVCFLIFVDAEQYGATRHWSYASGIIRKDGSPKPSFYAIKEIRHALY